MWHFKEEDEEEIERLDLLEEETEPLENMIDETSFQPTSGFNRQEVNPFLDSEPVENLEKDLAQTSTTDNKENADAIGEQPLLYNAPQYSGGYTLEGSEISIRGTDRFKDEIVLTGTVRNNSLYLHVYKYQGTIRNEPFFEFKRLK